MWWGLGRVWNRLIGEEVRPLKNIGQYIKSKNWILSGFTFGEAKYLRYKIKDSGFKIKIQPARSPVDVMRQFKTQKELVLIHEYAHGGEGV